MWSGIKEEYYKYLCTVLFKTMLEKRLADVWERKMYR
jgi:hypothetical protein